MKENTITMTTKELARYEVINQLLLQKINGTEAAKMIGLSVRQVKNLKIRVKKYGARGLIHRARGRASNRRINTGIREQAERNLKKSYADFGPTFAREKLQERHGIVLGKETVRQIMTDIGLWRTKPRKKNKEFRAWRPRKEYQGEMEQFDGSYHLWFELRADPCCLLASVDDATGTITRAEFGQSESVPEVFGFWSGYVKERGKPLSVYLDKYSTYKNIQAAAKDDPELLTQFQRAMDTLAIELITAHSPQAKGRIERLFETLQDRLVKELRLAAISTIPEANRFLETYLPKFNKQFGVQSAKKGNLHRKLTSQEIQQLPHIFSRHSHRYVANDFTIRFKNQWIQLQEQQPALVRRKETVLMEEWLDESLHILLRGKELNFRILPERPQKVHVRAPALTTARIPWKPPVDHPWRRPLYPYQGKVEQPISN
jgi:transposase